MIHAAIIALGSCRITEMAKRVGMEPRARRTIIAELNILKSIKYRLYYVLYTSPINREALYCILHRLYIYIYTS